MAQDEDSHAVGPTPQPKEQTDPAGSPNEPDGQTLLQMLDPDPMKAVQELQGLYGKLISYFSNRLCSDPENLAAETISRADRAIVNGKTLSGENAVSKFIFGIARNVKREDARSRQKEDSITGAMQISSNLSYQPDNRRAECLKRCLDLLPPKDRALIIVYEDSDPQQRKALAKKLEITCGGLRAKVKRIRERLRACAKDC